ncbi:kinase-like domain-containing protein [Trametes polyzona]|nr:kinase-like domain-containing protein [Trametes polyzona]
MANSHQEADPQLKTWNELSALSDDELYDHFYSSGQKFPASSLVNTVDVRRIASDAVMRAGSVRDSEILTMLLVREASTIPVPAVRRVIKCGEYNSVVVDYIPGRPLEDCWQSLTLWQRLRIIWTIRDYVRQLRRIRVPDTLRKSTFPGPLAPEPRECYGSMFTVYGAGPFASYEELTAWFMHKLDVNRRIRHYPPDDDPITFDSSLPLVLTHGDMHPGNFIVGDDGQLWLIDWELSGFYPQWFEYLAMRNAGGWGPEMFGRWWLWVLGFMAGFYERQLRFIASIGWALNTGVFL